MYTIWSLKPFYQVLSWILSQLQHVRYLCYSHNYLEKKKDRNWERLQDNLKIAVTSLLDHENGKLPTDYDIRNHRRFINLALKHNQWFYLKELIVFGPAESSDHLVSNSRKSKEKTFGVKLIQKQIIVMGSL